MKKGDLKKQEILDTAEQLFCKNGYENTSIQDLIDILHSSKGSFYHHFVSKEALLEAICARRAKESYESTALLIRDEETALRNLNRLLSGLFPFLDEKLSFLLMLLPVFQLPEGKTLKTGYCDALAKQYMDAVIQQLKYGSQSNELICSNPDMTADLMLTIVNRLWTRICDLILLSEEQGIKADYSEMLQLTDCCRLTIERMVCMPYGSLDLVNMSTLQAVVERIHSHWPG